MFEGFTEGKQLLEKLHDQDLRTNNARSFAFKCLLSVQTQAKKHRYVLDMEQTHWSC